MRFLAFILVSAAMLPAQVGTPLPKPGAPEQVPPVTQSATPEDVASAKQARAVLDKMIAALGGSADLNI